MKSWVKRVRGALGNAVTWAVSWVGGGTAVLGLLHLTGLFQLADPSEIFSFFVPVLGMTGFLTGIAFSTYLPFAFRDQSVLEIRTRRFVVGGAVIAGLITPLLIFASPLGSELGGSTTILILSEIWTVVLGGLTAGVSLKLAKRASRHLSDTASVQLANEQDEVLRLLGES